MYLPAVCHSVAVAVVICCKNPKHNAHDEQKARDFTGIGAEHPNQRVLGTAWLPEVMLPRPCLGAALPGRAPTQASTARPLISLHAAVRSDSQEELGPFRYNDISERSGMFVQVICSQLSRDTPTSRTVHAQDMGTL